MTLPQGGRAALVLVRNDLSHDSRIAREVATLAGLGLRTTLLGQAERGAPPPSTDLAGAIVWRVCAALTRGRNPVSRAVPRAGLPAARRTRSARLATRVLDVARRANAALATTRYVGAALRTAARDRPALVHCNDHNTVWAGLAVRAVHRSALVYDTHELWADRNMRPEWRPRLIAEEHLFLRAADATMTPSPGYAEELARRHRLPAPRLVRNIPIGAPLASAARPGVPTVVYSGGLTVGRGLEETIRALALLDDVRLRLIGPVRPGFDERLRGIAREVGVAERVDIVPPVPPNAVVEAIASAHLGVALIQPVCRSYELTLPNKLFEYLAAGLPILVSDLPVMADFVLERDVGHVAPPDRPEAIAGQISELLAAPRNARLRDNVRRVSSSLTWELEQRTLVDIYCGVLNHPSPGSWRPRA